jgi:hypothetical protein
MRIYLYGPDINDFELTSFSFRSPSDKARNRTSTSSSVDLSNLFSVVTADSDAWDSLFDLFCSGTTFDEAWVSTPTYTGFCRRFTKAIMNNVTTSKDNDGNSTYSIGWQFQDYSLVKDP